jgi:hypothetical protein
MRKFEVFASLNPSLWYAAEEAARPYGGNARFAIPIANARLQALPAGPIINQIAHQPQRAGFADVAER